MGSRGDCEFRIIIVGEPGVGKTSLAQRYATGRFQPRQQMTKVADRTTKETVFRERSVKICMWDTSSQKFLRNAAANYYDGVLLVYDITDVTSFKALSGWLMHLRKKFNGGVIIVVGNKSDLLDSFAIPHEKAVKFTKDEHLDFMESSAKNGDNISNIFESLISRILLAKKLATSDELNNASSTSPTNTVDQVLEDKKDSGLSIIAREVPIKPEQSNQNSKCNRHKTIQSVKTNHQRESYSALEQVKHVILPNQSIQLDFDADAELEIREISSEVDIQNKCNSLKDQETAETKKNQKQVYQNDLCEIKNSDGEQPFSFVCYDSSLLLSFFFFNKNK